MVLTSCLHEDPASPVQVILLRRLHLSCLFTRAGAVVQSIPVARHQAACAREGVLGRRGFAWETVVARICREVRERVSSNVMVCDLDLPVPDASDSRRLEVVVDTTTVCALPVPRLSWCWLWRCVADGLRRPGDHRPVAVNL